MENADLTKKLGPSFSPRCLNLKLEEKRQECEDNILYYTQREAELEAKIDELMTRLQEQTAAYMKLQSEFDNYEWWEEGEGGGEGESSGGGGEERRRGASRESLLTRSRPTTRPPTREEVHRFSDVAETMEAEQEEEQEQEEQEEVVVMVNGGFGNMGSMTNYANGDALAPEGYSSLPAALVPREEAEPEVPPRRGEKGEEQRNSWLEDGQST